MKLNRRTFLEGLFGVATVAAVGAMPKALQALPDDVFVNKAHYFAALKKARSGQPEIWSDGKDYSFTAIPGWRPLREESDRIAEVAIRQLWEAFADDPPK